MSILCLEDSLGLLSFHHCDRWTCWSVGPFQPSSARSAFPTEQTGHAQSPAPAAGY